MKCKVINTSAGTVYIDTHGVNNPEQIYPLHAKQTLILDIVSEERLAALKQQFGSAVSLRKLSK